MNKKILSAIIATIVLLLTSVPSVSHATAGTTNPFLTPATQEKTEVLAPSSLKEEQKPENMPRTVAAHEQEHSGLYGMVLVKITIWQKFLREEMTQFAKNIHANPFGKSFFLFLGFSFLYGIIHAIGPGHGKAVVCAYFMSRKGKILSTAFLSWLITTVHVCSATLAVCGAYLLFKTGMSGFEQVSNYLQTLSFSIIVVIGLFLFISSVLNLKKSFNPNGKTKNPEKCASIKEMATVAFFTGVIPCPGAAIILVYTLITGILWAGLISMAILATGMGITTFIFAIAASSARSAIAETMSESKIRKIIPAVLSISGSLVIMGFGIMMLASN